MSLHIYIYLLIIILSMSVVNMTVLSSVLYCRIIYHVTSLPSIPSSTSDYCESPVSSCQRIVYVTIVTTNTHTNTFTLHLGVDIEIVEVREISIIFYLDEGGEDPNKLHIYCYISQRPYFTLEWEGLPKILIRCLTFTEPN